MPLPRLIHKKMYFFKGNFVYEIFFARIQTFEKVRIFGSPCCVPRLRRKQPIECLKKFCVRILKGMSKGSRACVNFEGKIRTQNFLKVNSELYTTVSFSIYFEF